jgi:hypothetical protein
MMIELLENKILEERHHLTVLKQVYLQYYNRCEDRLKEIDEIIGGKS